MLNIGIKLYFLSIKKLQFIFLYFSISSMAYDNYNYLIHNNKKFMNN